MKKVQKTKVLTAKEARLKTNKYKPPAVTREQQFILNRIADYCSLGLGFLVTDYPDLYLSSDDYDFFENLGYTVIRPHHRDGMEMSGQISW